MQDPPRKFDVTSSKPTLETQYFQQHIASVSIGSGHSYSQSPAVRSASYSTSSPSRSELSRNGSSPRSPRRLPVPPTYASPASPPASSLSMPSSSSSSLLSSSSTLSLPTPRHPPHSCSVRPLPKVPNSVPVIHETSRHKRGAHNDESPATSTISSIMSPRKSTDVEENRRRNLSKLRRHLGCSVPLDFIIPSLDRDEESDSSSSDEEWCDMPTVPITPQCLSELTEAISPILENTADEMHEKTIRRYSRRWLREKKGRRWVEDDYSVIIQTLRALR